MKHINEKIDTIRIGFHYAVMEFIMLPIVMTLIFFDVIRGNNVINSLKARCLDPIKNMIKREVTWYYHPEEDPVFRKVKGL